MNGKQLLKEIKGVFISPVKKTYFGKVKHGCPYFYPWNYCGSIFRIRIINKDYSGKYYSRIKKLFRFNFVNKRIELYIGSPVVIKIQHLGWKDKWNTPRFEWAPALHIYFFGLQYYSYLTSPINNYSDTYWEMILWWMNYCDRDIKKAEDTWGWVSHPSGESTWNNKYLK